MQQTAQLASADGVVSSSAVASGLAKCCGVSVVELQQLAPVSACRAAPRERAEGLGDRLVRRRIRRWRKRLRPLTSTPWCRCSACLPLAPLATAGPRTGIGAIALGVLVTLTTVGYGDQVPNTDAGRWVTAAILVGGLVVVQQTLQWMLSLQETGYFQLRRRQRQLREIQRMRQHVILCGYGRIGREIADQLIAEGVPLLVIENAPDDARAARERQLEVLEGDATLDETLQEAGVFDCRALVAALPNNAANLYVVLSARGLSSGCRLIARADSKEAERKLRLAGADAVVSPYISGGRQMAAIALAPWRSISSTCWRAPTGGGRVPAAQ